MRDLNPFDLCQRDRLDYILLIFSWPRHGHLDLSTVLYNRSFSKMTCTWARSQEE